MCLSKGKKALLVSLAVFVCFSVSLVLIFLIGRYGWKLGGFQACEGAGIESVAVTDGCVRITGFYPGSFPEGFIGCYSAEENGKLYVGFRFSAVFGFFETGDFSISVPVRGEISEVIMKTAMGERTLWTKDAGRLVGADQYGIYIRLDYRDAESISVSYCGKTVEHDTLAWENGEFCYFDCDIMMEAKNTGVPIGVVVAVKKTDGSVTASREFLFEAEMEKMYLRITESGEIEG